MKTRIVLSLIVILVTFEKISGHAAEISYESMLDNCKSVLDDYKKMQSLYEGQMTLNKQFIKDLRSNAEVLQDNNISLKNQKEMAEDFKNSLSLQIEQVIYLNQSLIKSQNKLDKSKNIILDLKQQLKSKSDELDAKNKEIRDKSVTIEDNFNAIQNLQEERDGSDIKIRKLQLNFDGCNEKIQTQNQEINELKMQIHLNNNKISEQNEVIASHLTCCKASSCEPFGNSNSIHAIQVPGVGLFKVLCDGHLNGTGWTVIQRRITGSVSFYRNWTDYKDGFGDLSGEFFIGLEKLHHMTKAEQQELYIHMEDFEGQTRFAKYDNFQVGSEEESYALKSLGSFEGNVSDQLRLNEGQKFSTYDRKNDKSSSNCALQFSGGWWYYKCGLT